MASGLLMKAVEDSFDESSDGHRKLAAEGFRLTPARVCTFTG